MRSYSLNTIVPWGDILHLLRWRIRVLNREGLQAVSSYHDSLQHNYQNYAIFYRAKAVSDCERVLHFFSVFNILRKFLRYKALSYSDLNLNELVSFYELEKDNVSEGDLAYPRD